MSADAFGFDLFARHTGTDGRSFVDCHRVWDKTRFVEAQVANAERDNAKAPDGPRLARFEQIDEVTYRAVKRMGT